MKISDKVLQHCIKVTTMAENYYQLCVVRSFNLHFKNTDIYNFENKNVNMPNFKIIH